MNVPQPQNATYIADLIMSSIMIFLKVYFCFKLVLFMQSNSNPNLFHFVNFCKSNMWALLICGLICLLIILHFFTAIHSRIQFVNRVQYVHHSILSINGQPPNVFIVAYDSTQYGEPIHVLDTIHINVKSWISLCRFSGSQHQFWLWFGKWIFGTVKTVGKCISWKWSDNDK